MHTLLKKILRNRKGKISLAKVTAIGVLAGVFLALILRSGVKIVQSAATTYNQTNWSGGQNDGPATQTGWGNYSSTALTTLGNAGKDPYIDVTTTAGQMNLSAPAASWTQDDDGTTDTGFNESNLKAQWSFDEGTGVRVSDTSGNNNHGIHAGSLLLFDGANDYVNIANEANFDFDRLSAFSLEVWVKGSDVNNTRYILSKLASTGGYGLYIDGASANNDICFVLVNSSNSTQRNVKSSGVNILDGNWHHLIATSSGTDDVSGLNLYIDGSLNRVSDINTLSGSILNSVNLNIGRNTLGGSCFGGLIDEVRVYARELTSAEVSQHYQGVFTGANPVSAWSFSEGTGQNIADSFGANTGTLGLDGNTGSDDPFWQTDAPGIWSASGKYGKAMVFNGKDDYVNLASGFSDFTSGFTVSLWASPSANDSYARFIDLGNGSASDNIIFGRSGTSNDLIFEVYSGGISGGLVTAASAITNNEWHNYAATVNVSGAVVIYKDGVSVGTGTTAVPVNINRTKNYIGKSNWATHAYYAGSIDDTRIYNTALTPEQVKAVVANAKGKGNVAVSGSGVNASIKLTRRSAYDFILAYDSASDDICAFGFDPVRNVLYGGGRHTSGSKNVYRCALSTGCDEAIDWTLPVAVSNAGLRSFGYDSFHQVLYYGHNGGVNNGYIVRCDAATYDCSASGNWATVSSTTEYATAAIVFDSTNKVLYSGTTTSGNIYRCDTNSGCAISTDWALALTGTGETSINSLAFDSAHNILYAGTSSGGKIYRCNTATGGGCSLSTDWVLSYDSPATDIQALAFDSTHNILYAGGTGAKVYRCDTASGCAAPADWTISYDLGSLNNLRDLKFDSTHNILYAIDTVFPASSIFRCDTASDCNEPADWTSFSNFRGYSLMPLGTDDNAVFIGAVSAGYIYKGRTLFNSSGTYISNAYDTGVYPVWGIISWAATVPANTTITVFARASDNQDMSGGTAWVQQASGTTITGISNSYRYIQYKAELTSSDGVSTPSLESLTINYTGYPRTAQELISSYFNSGAANMGISQLRWTETVHPAQDDLDIQLQTAPAATGCSGSWNNCTWLGPTSGSDYYTDPAGGEMINPENHDGVNDQWFRYKVRLSALSASSAVLSDFNVDVAAPPAAPTPLAPSEAYVTKYPKPMFAWSVADGVTVQEYRLKIDSLAEITGITDTSYKYTGADLALGAHTWKVRAKVDGVWSNYCTPVNFTVDGTGTTLTVPSGTTIKNGLWVYDDVTINSGGILTHDTNVATKTNWLNLIVMNNLTINTGGSINVDGKGYGGGNPNAYTCTGCNGAGAGCNTAGCYRSVGGGHGGQGSASTVFGSSSEYDDIYNPNELGSGGGGSSNGSGGNGGGLVRLTVGALVNDGSITANGNVGGINAGGGAGGTIYIFSSGAISGSGLLKADGGNSGGSTSTGGGGGRIALYYTSNTISNITINGGGGSSLSGAGTLFTKDIDSPTNTNGTLTLANAGVNINKIYSKTFDDIIMSAGANAQIVSGQTVTLLKSGSYVVYGLDVAGSFIANAVNNLTINGTFSVNSGTSMTGLTSGAGIVTINSGGSLTHQSNGAVTSKVHFIDWNLASLTINSGGSINVDGKGYMGGTVASGYSCTGCYGAGNGSSEVGAKGAGGGYGGTGGNANVYSGGAAYSNPFELGSGGGASSNSWGSNGGGLVKLTVGPLVLNGFISANGINKTGCGAGSGGGIFITSSGAISGSGYIRANGGTATSYGGGGGGRISLAYSTNSVIDVAALAGGGYYTVPATNGVVSGVINSFTITGVTPSSPMAGSGFSATVTAKDALNNTIPSTFSVVLTNNGAAKFFTQAEADAGYADAGGATSETYTLSSGIGTIYVKDNTAQTVTLTATGNTKTGTANVTIVPGSLGSFVITAGYPTAITAGGNLGPGNIEIKAYDSVTPTPNLKTNYTGTAVFSSATDGQAAFPASYTFIAGDNGVHTFPGSQFVFKTAGPQTFKVTDGAISQTSSSITVSPAATVSYSLNAPADITAGGARAAYTVTRKDFYNNLVISGPETVYLYTSSDGANAKFYDAPSGGTPVTSVVIPDASSSANFYYYDEKSKTPIPSAWTITASDNISAPDGAAGKADATDSIIVNPATAAKFTITGNAAQVAGVAQQLTISAYDTYNNLVSAGANNYNGDYALTFSGAGTVSSGGTVYNSSVTDKTGANVNFGSATTITFTNGVSSAGASMKLYKAETAPISATATGVTTPAPISVTVAPALTISSPNGTEQWKAGSAHYITWTKDAGAGIANVKLSYSTDGGASFKDIITDSVANTSPYSWTVPDYLSDTVKVKIENVSNPAVFDESNSNFNIIPPTFTVLTPSDGSITLSTGQAYNITWSSEGSISNNLSLYYSTDGGLSYPNTIATGETNDGTYPWTVQYDPGTFTRVKIVDAFSQSLKDTNDAQFNLGTYSNTVINGAGNSAGVKLSPPSLLVPGNLGTDLGNSGNCTAVGGTLNAGKCDWTPANGINITTSYYNIGTFTVASGSTVNIASGQVLQIKANTINIAGTLDGNARGYAGGTGGLAAHTDDGLGHPGNPGVNAGSYGGVGGPGGAAGNPLSCSTGYAFLSGVGGSSVGSVRGTNSGIDIDMGGGGAGGGGYMDWVEALCNGQPSSHFVISGADGEAGGGAVYLYANGTITVSGTGMISVNGGAGGHGSNGPSGCYSMPSGGGGAGASGGGVLINGNQVIVNGTLRANGGVGGAGGTAECNPGNAGQVGGSGRIKIFANTITNTNANYSATGYLTGSYVCSNLTGGLCNTGSIYSFNASTSYNSSGNFTSRVLDTGGVQNYNKIEWSADVPAQCGAGAVKFQLASAAADTGPWTYYGPTGVGDFYTASATQINSVHNGQRYIRYKAFLATADGNYTPTVNDVKISFTDSTSADRVISDESDNTFTIQPTPITVADVEPVTNVVGITGDVNVNFTTINTIPADGKVVVTFPADFTLNSNGTTTASSSTMDGTLSVNIAGQVVTLTRSGGTTQTTGAEVITLTNIKNPNTPVTTGAYSLSTQTSAGKKIDEAASISGDVINAVGALTAANVEPASLVAGVAGNVTVSFTTVNPILVDGKIVVVFPGNFTFDSGGTTTASSGTMDGTLTVDSIAGQTVTLSRSGAGRTQQPAAAEVITLTNIRNHTVTGPTGVYGIKITTSSATGSGIIEQKLDVSSDTIIPDSAFKIVFTAGPYVLTAGVPSAAYTVQLQDQYSNFRDTDNGVSFTLTSNAGSGRFDTSAAGAFSNSSILINTVNSVGTFYYKDTAQGSPAITVAGTGLTSAVQVQTLGPASASKVYITPPGSVIAGVVSAAWTINSTDAWGNPKAVDADTTFDLSSNSAGMITFYSNALGTIQITSVTISAAASSKTFYYKDTKTGLPAITATWTGAGNSMNPATASASIAVQPAAIASYVLNNTSPQVAGTGWTEVVSAKDQFGNTVTTDSATLVTLSAPSNPTIRFYTEAEAIAGYTAAGLATLTYQLSSGEAFVYLKDTISETIAYTAIDGNSKTGTSGNITVNPGALTGTNVQPDSLAAGVKGPVAIYFTTANPLLADGKIKITFGAAFDLTSVAATDAFSTTAEINGNLSISKSGQEITITRSAGTAIPAATVINDLVIMNVKNPIISGSTGVYQMKTTTAADVICDQAVVIADTVLPGIMTATNVQPASLVGGVTGNVTVSFTTANPLPADGKIKVIFGNGFDVSGVTGASSAANIDGTLTTSISGKTVTITRSGGGQITSNTVISDLVIGGVKNPSASGSTGVYQIATTSSGDIKIDEDAAVSADIISAAYLANTNVEPEWKIVSTTAKTTVSFTTTNPVPADGKIKVTFPAGFDLTNVGVNDASSAVDINGALTVSKSGQEVSITRSGGTQIGSGVLIDDLIINNVKNPSAAGVTGTYQIKTTDASNVLIDQDSAVTQDTIVSAGALSAVNVEPASLVAGVTGTAGVSFTTANPIPADGKIKVTFGNGFDVSGVSGAASAANINGTLSTSFSGKTVIITRSGGSQISGGAVISDLVIAGIKNPIVTGSTGTYQVAVTDKLDAAMDLDAAVGADTITPGIILPTNVQPASLIAGVTGNVTVGFTTANPLPADGKIKVTFGNGFDVSAVTGASSAANINGTLAASVSGKTVIITRSAGTQLAAGTVINDLVIAGVKNPVVTGSTGVYQIATTTSGDVKIDEDAAVAADTITAASLTNTDVEPEWKIVSTTAKTTVSFTTNNPLPADGKIKITFPAGFDLTNVGANDASSAGDINGTLSVSKNGQEVIVSRSGGTQINGSVLINDLVINNVKNPSVAGAAGVYQIKTTDASGAVIDENTAVTADTIVAAGALSSTNVQPLSLVAGVTGEVAVSFTTVNPIPADGKIKVTFGNGFDVSGVTGATSAANINGTLSTSFSGKTVIITRSGGSQLSGGTVVGDLVIAGIKNPVVSGSTGTYQIAVTDKLDGTMDIDSAVAFDTISAAALTYTSIVPASLQANVTGNVTVSFTANNPLPANGKIKLTFPAGFDLGAVLLGSASSAADLDGTLAITTRDNVNKILIITRSGATPVAAGGRVDDLVIANVKNPGVSGGTGVYKVQTQNNVNAPIDEDNAVAESTILAGTITSAAAVVNNKAAGQTTTVTISADITNPIPNSGFIKIGFPVVNTFDFGTVTANSPTIGLNNVGATVVSGNTVKILVSGGYAGALFTDLVISGVTSPGMVGDPGTWIISTANTSDIVIDQVTGIAGDDTITAGAITGANVTLTADLTAGGSPVANIAGTITTNIPANGYIKVTFPAGFTLNTAAGAIKASGTAPSLSNVDCSVSGNVVSIPVAGGFTAGAFNNLRITQGVTNPHITGDPGAWIITTTTSGGGIFDQEVAIAGVDAITTGAISAANIVLTGDLTAGASPVVGISGTMFNDIPAGGFIKLTFPAGFVLNPAVGAIKASANSPALTDVSCSVSGNVVSIPVAAGFSAGAVNNLRITQGVNNPYLSGDPGTWIITSTNNAGINIDQTTGIAGTDLISAGVLLSPAVTAMGNNYSAGAIPDYTVAFTTPVTIPVSGKIKVTFDGDYYLGGALAVVSGNAGATISALSNVLTITAGTAIDANTAVSIAVSGIKNPNYTKVTNVYAIEAQNASSVLMAQGSAVANTITAGIISPTVTLASLIAGATSDVTIAFTAANPILANGDIEVTFPAGFNITGAVYSSGTAASLVSKANNLLILNATNTINAGANVSIVISGVRNPMVSGSAGTCVVQTQTPADVVVDQGNAPASLILPGVLTSATNFVTSPTYLAGDNTKNYTIAFAAVNPVEVGGKVKVVFDTDYDLSGVLNLIGGNAGATLSASGSDLIVTLGTAISAGESVTLAVSGIKNPPSAQTTTDYIIQTLTAGDAVIDAGTAAGNVILLGTLSGVSISSPSYIAGDNTKVYTIAFTTDIIIPSNGDVQVTFDGDYDLSGAGFISGNAGSSVSYAGNILTVNLGTEVSAGSSLSLVLSGIKNPVYTKVTAAYTIEIQDAGDHVMTTGSASGNTITAGSISPIITHASLVAGAVSDTTIGLTVSNPIAVNGDIQITFPAGFDISAAAYSSGNAGSAVTVSGQILTINLGTAVAGAGNVNIVLSGIRNPQVTGFAGTYAVETQTVSDVLIDEGIASGNTIIPGVITPIITHASLIAGAVSDTTIGFTAGNPVPLNGDIQVTFPSGFDLIAAVYSSGNAGSTVSAAGQVLTINLGTAVASGSNISIVVSGIKNPPVSGLTGAYLVETQTSSDVKIDEGTAAGNTITPGVLIPSTNFVTSASYIVNDNTKNYNISFVTVNPIPENGDIQVTFDSAYNLSGSLSIVSGNAGATVSAAANVLTINLGTAISADSPVSIAVSGIKNPGYVKTTADYIIQTQNDLDVPIDEGTAGGNIITAGSITSGNAVLSNFMIQNSSTVTISAKFADSVPAGGFVKIGFPTGNTFSFGTVIANSPTIGLSSVVCSVAVASDVVTIPVSVSFTPGAAAFTDLVLSGITNPGTIGDPGTWSITTTNSSSAVIDQVTGIAGNDNVTAGSIVSANVVLSGDLKAGGTPVITISSNFEHPVPISGYIKITFPSTNHFSFGAVTAVSPTIFGSTTPVSCPPVTGNIVTIPVGGSAYAAGVLFTDLVLSGVTNPAVSGDPGNWVITTSNFANIPIDQAVGIGGVDTILPGDIVPSVSHDSLVAGEVSNTTISFTASNPIPVNGDVQVTFSSGFDISSAAYSSGNNGTTVSVSGQVLTLNLGTAAAKGNSVSIVVSGIRNPQFTGATGTYAVETQTAIDAKIDEGAAVSNTITAGAISPVITHASVVAGAVSNTTINFTANNPIPVNGVVRVTFPVDFDISSAVYSSGNNGSTVSAAGRVLAINLGTAVAKGGNVSVVVGGIRNPQVTGATGTYTVETYTSLLVKIDEGTAVSNTITAGAVSPVITHASLVAGAVSNMTISFTAGNPLPVNGDIQIAFPAGFDISSAAYSSGNTGSVVSVSGQVLTLNLGTAVVKGSDVSIVVSGIVNPPVTGSAGTYTVETQNSSDVKIDEGTAAGNTIIPGVITPIITHSSLVAGAASTTTVSFTAANPIPVDGDIQITFPAGFDISAAAYSSGNAGSTVLTLGQVLSINLGTAVAKGGSVSIQLSGINNPPVSGTTGTYAAETQNNTDVKIDAGNASGNTMIPAALASTNVQPVSLVASARGNVTVSFVTSNPIPASGKIKVTFGSGFDLTTVTGASSASDIDGTLTVSVLGQTVTIIRSSGSAVAKNSTIDDLTIAGVTNPVALASTGTYSIVTSDSSDNVIDEDLAVSADTITGSITITAPVSGTKWAVNEANHVIKWNTIGNISKVDIAYSTNGGVDWVTIVSGYEPIGYVGNGSASYMWNSIPDVVTTPQTTPTKATLIRISDAVAGHTSLVGTSSSFDIIYYKITWKALDAELSSNLSDVAVTCSTGWIETGLSSSAGIYRYYPYGTYSTTFSKDGYLDGGKTDWVAGSNHIETVYLESTATLSVPWNVMTELLFDTTNDKVNVASWIEKRGILRSDPTSALVEIYDSANNLIKTLYSASPDSNGLIKQDWDVSAISEPGVYTVKTTIVYHSTAYTGATTFSLAAEKKEAAFRNDTVAQLATLDLATSTIKTAVNTTLPGTIAAQADLTREKIATESTVIQTSVSGVKTETSKILTATGTAPISETISKVGDTISANITNEVKPHIKSGILNMENVVKLGDTVTIRYRVESGRSPKIDVYDSKNILKINKGAMLEVGTTGVYEYPVKFTAAWGLGEFTIVCSESSLGTVDAFVVTVTQVDLTDVSGQTSAILGSTSGLSGLNEVADNLNSQFTSLEDSLTRISENIVNKVQETRGVVGELESVFKQLSGMSDEIKKLGATEGINLEKLYEVSKDKKDDLLYLKNKTQELKAVMELNQKMMENASKKPVVQTWFEFK